MLGGVDDVWYDRSVDVDAPVCTIPGLLSLGLGFCP